MTGQAEQTAREVHDSAALEGLARVGIASRGLVWLVVGLLALSVLVRGGDRQTDRQGALGAIADKPFGGVLLVVLVVGFAAYALWLLLSAAVGHRDEEGGKRALKRAKSAFKAVVYGYLAVSTVRFLTSGSGGDQTSSTSARVMGHSGGRLLVGVVGVAVIAVGVTMAVRSVRGKHMDKLDQARLPSGWRTWVDRLGTVGLAGRGLVLGLLGGFLLRAALQFDPGEAKGLDAALQTMAGQAYGRALLAVAVLGVLGYALWSFVEAAYRKL